MSPDSLLKWAKEARTIAVVGLSMRREGPAFAYTGSSRKRAIRFFL